MRFEWDDRKAAANLRKHGVSFDEAAEVFDDPYLAENDDGHSHGEVRFVVIGYSSRRLLLVGFTERGGARFASSRRGGRRHLKKSYMKVKTDKKPKPADEEFVGELVVTEEDYQEGLKRGWTDDDMLKPGRYKFRRGSFLARHPELKDRMRERPERLSPECEQGIKVEKHLKK